jgi:hypothetical protein
MTRKLISFSLGSFNLVSSFNDRGIILSLPDPIAVVKSIEIAEPGIILVKSNTQDTSVFSSLLNKLGNTPLKLSHTDYLGKTIIVNSGGVNKRIDIVANIQIYEVNF